jgi:biopolymer transport protein ExbB/TolQ
VTPAQRVDALDAAKRASARSARAVHCEMKRGLSSLASIAVTAPFFGVLGWVLGFLNSFPGFEGPKRDAFAIVAERLSESLMPIELGLLVALLAYFGHKYFLVKLEDFDVEMENASLQLVNQLGATKI